MFGLMLSNNTLLFLGRKTFLSVVDYWTDDTVHRAAIKQYIGRVYILILSQLPKLKLKLKYAYGNKIPIIKESLAISLS